MNTLPYHLLGYIHSFAREQMAPNKRDEIYLNFLLGLKRDLCGFLAAKEESYYTCDYHEIDYSIPVVFDLKDEEQVRRCLPDEIFRNSMVDYEWKQGFDEDGFTCNVKSKFVVCVLFGQDERCAWWEHCAA